MDCMNGPFLVNQNEGVMIIQPVTFFFYSVIDGGAKEVQ